MKFFNFILPKDPKRITLIFILFFIITIILTLGNINTRTDNDVSMMLPVNDETEYEREKINVLGKEFPSNQMAFVGVKDNPFTPEKIQKLWEMCNELNSLDVVRSSMNPFNAVYFEKFADSFKLGSYSMKEFPKTTEEISTFIDKLSSNRYLVGSVISYDKQTAGIVLSMNYNALMGKELVKKNFIMNTLEFLFGMKFGQTKIDRSYFCQKIEEVLKKYDKTFDIFFAGVPVYEAKVKSYMQKDVFILIIPVLFLMILTFYLSFRSFRGTVLPVLTILLSLGWTMGLIGWLRIKLSIIGILIPPLVMTVGSSYTIQFINSYYINVSSKFKDSRELMISVTKLVTASIILAGLTTIAGFGSFATANIKPIREFGLLISVSIVFTLFITFLLVSNMLSKIPKPKAVRMDTIKNDVFTKVMDKVKMVVNPLKYFWVSLFFLLIIVFAIVLPQLKVETNPANYFKESDNVKKSLIFLQKNFGGTNSYNITVRSSVNKRNFFKTREGLLAAKKVHDYLATGVNIDGFNMIGWYVSPVTLIEDLNFTLTGIRDIPQDEQVIKRFFNYLKVSNVEWVNSIMNKDFSAITFQVRPMTTNSKNDYIMTEQELSKLTERLKNDLGNIEKDDGTITVKLWGEILLLSKISKFLIKDQVWSLSTTAILVLLICLIYFRSVFYGIISLIPLSFGVLFSFTTMAIFKIPLDVATVMIAAVSIGMGVDNSILYLINYRRFLKENSNVKEAAVQAISFTARPILFTSAALVLGFSAFFLSSFRPIVYFGLLIALSMVSCNFATLFIMPSFLIISDRIKSIIVRR